MYEVQTICGKRINPNTRKPEYLVKWAGHSDANNSWEPEENLCFVKYLIEEYNANNKHKNTSKNLDVQQFMPQFGWPPRHSQIQRKIKQTVFPQYRQNGAKHSSPSFQKMSERQRSRQKNVKVRSDLKSDQGISFKAKRQYSNMPYPYQSFPYSHHHNPSFSQKPRMPPPSITPLADNQSMKGPLSLVPQLKTKKQIKNKKVVRKEQPTQYRSDDRSSFTKQGQQRSQQNKKAAYQEWCNYQYSQNGYYGDMSQLKKAQNYEQVGESDYNYGIDFDRDALNKHKVLQILNIQKNGDSFYYFAKTPEGNIWLQRTDIVPMYSTQLCEFYEKNILFQE